MKIGCVIQRYGLDISGGAELHCRLVAEHLRRRYPVEVFTTCARDYVTWKNEYHQGTVLINDVPVHRFPVRHQRNIRRFESIQNLVFHAPQPEVHQLEWIRQNGPYCPALVKAIRHRSDIDVWILFSYRYWTTVECLRAVRSKALLVPTAEHDPALHLSIFTGIFNLPGAIAYNSHEEKCLIQQLAKNETIPSDIVGVGLVEQPDLPAPDYGFQAVLDAIDPYIIYVGRIDKNKGCDHLFRMFQRYIQTEKRALNLALIGSSVIPIPDHPRIRHLGFVDESAKQRALERTQLLVMPSPFESLSMVLLESWRVARPVLVNAKCEVLEGQCRRSNGGLFYRNYEEFAACLTYLVTNREIADQMGRMGRAYYQTHYNWPVIETKYENLIHRMKS